jgi:hypothetical protein
MMEAAGKAVCKCELEPRAETRIGNENQISEHRDPRYGRPLHGHQFQLETMYSEVTTYRGILPTILCLRFAIRYPITW